MKIKFYLKRPKSTAATSIYALVNYNANSLKIYTKESIIPQHWNASTNSARNTPKFKEHPEFNQRLNNIRSTINKVFLDFKNENGHAEPSPAILKPLIEQALKKGSEKITFLDFFDDFVKRSSAGQRLNPRSKQPIRTGVAKGYKTTYNHLVEFSKKADKKLDFDNIDLDFHHEFSKYLTAQDFSLNYIGTHIKRIKAVMADATRKKINTNMEYASAHFIKTSEEADTIYLNDTELQEIESLELDEKLDNVRDLFLIGAYTGLRFSDFSILKPSNIADGFIRIKQVKTGDPVTIPVHPVVKKILAKRNGALPRAISNEKLNEYLKKVCAETESLKKMGSHSITKGGRKDVTDTQKFNLVTTHTARRSFATNEYLHGTPTITIMAITGHKTEKSFLKYIRISKEEHAVIMKEIWAKRNILKAV
ncbi:site-specific integrase [Agriterribacter sp.]|uniref:site-specific integrase n=1 Tax=Agriterribacter sp. TaxID=2821509 RepID=UPI002B809D1E|nr:phage integrase SAM-like domain-containing protein [Agriterribacter sp.]HTN09239.1 phage integrase SAM-like domain-containing protein [Agriterribacter sp.]